MWNLSGDDIQRALEELKGRRGAIQARYDSEMKQLESAIADIETFERSALNFVVNFKNEALPPAPAADPAPAPESIAAASANEQASVDAEPEPGPGPELVTTEKSSSRWRMRLSNAEISP
jgi:hypothetical protein